RKERIATGKLKAIGIGLAAVVLLFGKVDRALSQTVRWQPGPSSPGQDVWWIDYSRKFGPDNFELDSQQATKQAAQKRVQKPIAWSKSMGESEWQLAIIQVWAPDPTVARGKSKKDAGMSDMDKFLDDFQNELAQALKDVLKKNKQDVETAAKRVRRAE